MLPYKTRDNISEYLQKNVHETSMVCIDDDIFNNSLVPSIGASPWFHKLFNAVIEVEAPASAFLHFPVYKSIVKIKTSGKPNEQKSEWAAVQVPILLNTINKWT